jgi:hypothetical protein
MLGEPHHAVEGTFRQGRPVSGAHGSPVSGDLDRSGAEQDRRAASFGLGPWVKIGKARYLVSLFVRAFATPRKTGTIRPVRRIFDVVFTEASRYSTF